jgi:hypothetical protein
MPDPKLTPFSKPAAHTLVTDDEYLKGLGLASTTTGILYAYFCARDNNGRGDYVNRGIVRDGNNNEITNINQLLGQPTGVWSGWRNQGRNVGKYETQEWDKWILEETIDDDGNVRSFEVDLDWFDTFEPRGPVIKNGLGLFFPDGPGIGGVSGIDMVKQAYPQVYREPDKLEEDYAFLDNEPGFYAPITSMIVMNEFLISAANTTPGGSPAFSGMNTYGADVGFGNTFGRETLPALDEYINDIQAAKEGGVSWSGLLTFNTQLAGGQFTCAQKRWVKWTLYLEDEVPDPIRAEPIVVPSRNMVAEFARDELGRNTFSLNDGKVTTSDETQPQQKVLAETKLNYNSYLNKYESGTSQLMAIVMSGDLTSTVGISAAQIPDPDTIENSDVDSLINGDNLTKKVIPGTGVLLPLYMQNNNPKQWAPKYAEDEDCRDVTDLTKQTVVGYNFNPKKEYKRGDQVYVSQVGGIWHISDPGEGQVTGRPVSLAQQWTFQQFATNSEFFFKSRESKAVILPDTFERRFHLLYYQNDIKNGGVATEDGGLEGFTYSDQFTTVGEPYENILMDNGYWQISSFDWMDSQIFGTRAFAFNAVNGLSLPADKMSINQTLAFTDPVGQVVPRGGNVGDAGRNGCHSNHFFGAVFPDGYTVPGKFDEDRDYNILSWVSGEINTPLATGLVSFFDTTVENKTFRPFIDERDPEATPFQPFDRTDPMLPYFSTNGIDDPMPQIDAWDRIGNRASHSMFETYTNGTNKTLQHLPADVGCNAHISSKNGGPLYSVYRMAPFYRKRQVGTDSNIDGIKRGIRTLFESCTWLANENDREDSAFGFKPRDPSRIQFRPLKAELFASYHPYVNRDFVINPRTYWREPEKNLINGLEPRLFDREVNIFEYFVGQTPLPPEKNIFDGKGALVPERGLFGEPSVAEQAPKGWEVQYAPWGAVLWPNTMRGSHATAMGRQMKTQTNIHNQYHILDRNTFLNPIQDADNPKSQFHQAAEAFDKSTTPPIWGDNWVHSWNWTWVGTQGGEGDDFEDNGVRRPIKQGKDNPFTSDGQESQEIGLRYLFSDMRGTVGSTELQGLEKWQDVGNQYHNFNYWQSTEELPDIDYGFWWRDPYNVYNNNQDSWRDNGTARFGANGYGVITAQCTCTLNTKINYKVNTQIGMAAKLRANGKWQKTWDVGADRFNGVQTTNLCVTMFQWHPREQTVFDGPNFCVHHFNPRPDYQGHYAIGQTPEEHEADYLEEATAGEAWPFTDEAVYIVDNTPEVLRFDVDITGGGSEIPEVGVREPSKAVDTGDILESTGQKIYIPKPLDNLTSVFSDQIVGEEEGVQALPTNRSHLNLTRVGKLLPYRYQYFYYSMPLNASNTAEDQVFVVPNGSEIITVDEFIGDGLPEEEGGPDVQYAYVATDKLVVIDQGAGYAVGDIIGNATYGIRYEVTSVGDENKEITGFKILEYGEAEASTGTRREDKLQGVDGEGISIATLESSSGGAFFRAFYVNVKVASGAKIDQKPRYLQREKLISAVPGLPSESDSQYGFVSDITETPLLIDPEEASPYFKYDLFFFFHNDINMTHMSSNSEKYYAGPVSPGQPEPVDEQYIELQITGE